MKKLTPYCPICGDELIDKSDHIKKFNLYVCEKCKYSLPDSRTIDISFSSKGLAKALSNLCPYSFTFEDVYCASMEAFIQSLKVKNPVVQAEICSKTGPFCYSIREMFDDWRLSQTVYWKGKPINRQSKDYFMLITRAYEALLEQSYIYQFALKKVKDNGYKLIHSIGCDDVSETLLTPNEFTAILDHLIKDWIK